MNSGGSEAGQLAQKATQTAQNAVKFGIAAAKVFSGVATPKDWIVFIKGALPFAIASMFFSLIPFIISIGLIVGPILLALEYINAAIEAVGTFFEKLGNFLTFNGWNSDEEVYYDTLDDEYEHYKDLGADVPVEYVVAAINYQYLLNDINHEVVNFEESEEQDYDEMTSNAKSLFKHIVHEADGKAEVSNNNFLCFLRYGKWAGKMDINPSGGTMTYNKNDANKGDYTDGYIYKIFEDSFEHISDGDVPKEVERMIADIYSMAESASNKTSNNGRSGSNQICKGTYTATGTADIQINDLNKVYVNVANSSCAQGSLENCDNWDHQKVPFRDYIIGVTYGENGATDNYEAIKAQVVAAKSYTIGRIKSMGRQWHEVNGEYIIYMLGSDKDQVYADINSINSSKKDMISKAYDETVNDFIVNNNNEIVAASYCNDFGECSFCVQGNGTCFAQQSANKTVGQTYKEMLGYYYSAYNLYDMSDKSIQVSSVQCTQLYGSGQIRLPLDKFVVTSEWSLNRKNPVTGVWREHDGIDLAAGVGDPVYAIAPGKVIYAGGYGGYGNYVAISHDIDGDDVGDYVTTYAHNSEVLVSAGDLISGGTQIAKAGSTGNSTGPHLHFEIRTGATINSPDVNPKPYLEDIQNGTSIFNAMIKTELKYYNQGDYNNVLYCDGMRSGSSFATIQNSGCLPTSFAMVVAALRDGTVTPVNVANNICNNYSSYRVEGSGTSDTILTNQSFLGGYGISSTHITSDYKNKITEALNNGKILIANVRGGTFNPSGNGHYIVLVGIENNLISVYDPGARERTKSHSIDTVTSNISGGIWIFE